MACSTAQVRMTVDVQKYTAFANADLTRPVDEDGNVKPGTYNPGGPARSSSCG